MDLAFCAINYAKNKLYFSAAKNPMYLIRNGELTETKGDKRAIGEYFGQEAPPYNTHAFDLEKGDVIYIFTDGFADQFGGVDDEMRSGGGKKFTYKRFRELLLKIHQLPMEEQRDILWQEFLKWKGDLEQIDDVCVIGVRV
jgi:serine phosphatase RsbU (regulator of sigma subunit)